MNLIAVYFLFSVGTIFIVLVHVLNLATLKLKNRNLLGQYFKKGTPEHDSMLKSIGPRYVRATIIALILSLLNFAIAVSGVLHSFDRQKAMAIILITTLMALVIVVGIVLSQLGKTGEDAERHPTESHADDDDW
jgi:uncharacterized protein YhhL (DUF1145 family)